jgi:hypothetical protein
MTAERAAEIEECFRSDNDDSDVEFPDLDELLALSRFQREKQSVSTQLREHTDVEAPDSKGKMKNAMSFNDNSKT